MTAYIDTSVLVANYCPEPLSRTAQRLIGAQRVPTISPLVEIEFHSAVALKLRVGEFDLGAANQIVSLFRQHVQDGHYELVPIGEREYGLACDWIGQFSTPLRAPDSLHLAAAFNNGLVLITADAALAHAAKKFGVKCKMI